MNLKQLEYFVRVAELGSFSRAAMILDVAQPALSRQVRLLETDLRCALLQRTGRGVVLTEAGRRLFERGVGILQLVRQVREDLEAGREEPAGRVTIGLPPSLGRLLTLPLAERFRDHLPKAHLVIIEGLSTHLIEWIATGRVDLALVHNPEAQPAIEIQPLLDQPLCLVGPARRRPRRAGLRIEAPVPFTDLAHHRLVIPDHTQAIRRLLEAQAALSGVKLAIAWEASGVPAILELVHAGYGYAVLGADAVRAAPEPQAFVIRPIERPQLLSKLCLAQSAHKPATPLTRHAMRMLEELARRCGDQPDSGP
jgi:LysR family nitrogen assimilation transcriptional regulator